VGPFPDVKTLFGDAQLRPDLTGGLAATHPQGHSFPFKSGIELSSRFDFRNFSFFHNIDFPVFSLNWCPSNRSNPHQVNKNLLKNRREIRGNKGKREERKGTKGNLVSSLFLFSPGSPKTGCITVA
jgi:hypothetical protein